MSKEALTSCDDCRAAVRTNGAWNRFNPGLCLYCAARQVQHIQRFNLPREVKSARMTAALNSALKYGHNEKEVRALVRGDMAVSPAAKTDVKRNP